LIVDAFGDRFIELDQESLLIIVFAYVDTIFDYPAGCRHILADVVIWVGFYNKKQYYQYNN
jgi:hypothetical protein